MLKFTIGQKCKFWNISKAVSLALEGWETACTFHVPEDRLSNLQNVDKRIEYISAELKRQEDSIKDLDKKQDDLRENLTNMQTQMQKLAQAWWIAEGRT